MIDLVGFGTAATTRLHGLGELGTSARFGGLFTLKKKRCSKQQNRDHII